MIEFESRGRFVTDKEAARVVGLSHRTLQKKRVEGGGPPYHKIGRAVRYFLPDVIDWMKSHARRNTAAVPL